ncbi:FMN-binding protein [Streptomyces sp. NPDC048636]|uniref:FMN-binding protein n=1 Tax=Streptomyces sp. NPDC048636 TaxID=3155762 RepID=UPI00343AAA7A
MKRPVLATATTVLGLFLVLYAKPHQEPGGPAPAAAPSSRPTAETSTPSSPSSKAVSGRFTGEVVETRQGPVQVRITLAKSRLTKVDVLEGVHDEGPSAQAVPQLTERALTAQSADIDAVSGATYTSQGYISSLQSALDRADV